MAKLLTKFIADDAVDGSKFKLNNDEFLRARNAADSADVDIVKLTATDAIEFASKVSDPDSSAPTVDAQLANKKYVDDQVATISIPSVFELQGNWNATTNTPTLDNTDTGVDNYLYYVNVAGSVDFGAGSMTFAMGDWVYNVNGAWEKADNNDDVLSVNSQTGAVVLDTDDISEGTALYFTDARARTAVITQVITDGVTDRSPSEDAVFDALALKADDADVVKLAGSSMDSAASLTFSGGGEVLGLPASPSATGAASKEYVDTQVAAVVGADAEFEVFTLNGTDISNGYVDLGFEAMVDSLNVTPVGGLMQEPTTDYTIAYTGGAGSVTRVTFAGDLASELASADKLMIKYLRA